MLTFEELGPAQCRYVVNDGPPFLFCAAGTDGRPYCPDHDELCHDGQGVDWRHVAGMMKATERSIVHPSGVRALSSAGNAFKAAHGPAADRIRPIDEELKGADWIDKPGGLMGRT